MTPDVKIKDYYLAFIANAERDIQVYKDELEYYNNLKSKQLEFITINKDKYVELFKIYIEDENVATKRADHLIKNEDDPNRRFLLSQISKLGFTRKRIAQYEQMIRLARLRKNIRFVDYQTYVSNYYTKVHKFVLQGYGYEYNYGIGTLCICRWKVKSKKPKVDYNATNANKAFLLAQGKKLWDKGEAQWYAERGLPYDGIDYRVYLKVSHLYQIMIVKSKLFKNNAHKFEHTEYIHRKFKGMSYKEMADICKDIDDIANFQVDLKYKLNMYLHKNPSNYVLYIRNDEQDRYQYGAHNSKD